MIRKKRRRRPAPVEAVCPAETQSTIAQSHKGKPAFILAADDHIRNGAPICRTDDYVEAIFKKLEFRNKIARKKGVFILHAGDIGDKNYFVKNAVGWTAEIYNRFITDIIGRWKMYLCMGNHDLPGHDIENLNNSALGGLVSSCQIELLGKHSATPIEVDNAPCVYGCSWGEEIPVPEDPDAKNILVIHKMIINNLPLWPGQEAPKAQDILKQNPDYTLILSGDNHNTFTSEYKGRLLVNPGSMMRSTTKQFDHKPCFFLYYPESNTAEKVFYPIGPSEKVMSLAHIEKKKRLEKQTKKYADVVEKADLSDLKSFKHNVEVALSVPGIPNSVEYLTRRFVDNEVPQINQFEQFEQFEQSN